MSLNPKSTELIKINSIYTCEIVYLFLFFSHIIKTNDMPDDINNQSLL
jgi:hypothetical protein